MLTFNLICLAVLSQAPADPAAELKKTLDGLAAQHFTGVIYVEQDGKELLRHSVGYADRESKRPFSKDTGIEIGSIVKSLVNVATMKLVEEGKLSLSDPISKFFENVPEDKKAITVDMLREHKAGFKDVFGGDYQPMKRDELMDLMLKSELLFKPGEREEYSNSGYSMLSTILEKVTGKPIEVHLAETQLKPLGIERFGYVLPGWNPENTTVGYNKEGGRWGTPRDKFWYEDGPSWNLRGNGGMIATVDALAAWTRAAHTGKFLHPENYELFAHWGENPNPRAIWASAGGNGIFNTIVAYNPGRKVLIVAASTDARFVIEDHLRPLVPQMFGLAKPGDGRGGR